MDQEIRKILHGLRGELSNLSPFTAVGRRIVASNANDPQDIKDLAECCDIADNSAARALTLVNKLDDILSLKG